MGDMFLSFKSAYSSGARMQGITMMNRNDTAKRALASGNWGSFRKEHASEHMGLRVLELVNAQSGLLWMAGVANPSVMHALV